MELFKNRPMAAAAAIFVIVSVATLQFSKEVKLYSVMLLFLCLLFYICFSLFYGGKSAKTHPKRITAAVIFGLVAIFAVLNLYIRIDGKIDSVSEHYGKTEKIRATITDVIYETTYSGAYIAKITEVGGKSENFKAVIETDYSAELKAGDVIFGSAEFAPLQKSGSFDEEAYYKPKGVVIGAEAFELQVIEKDIGFYRKIAKLRGRLSAMFEIAAEESGGDYGMTAALFVGERSSLDKSVKRDFEYTGASHLLAVSGAHFTILLSGISYILSKLTLHKTPKTVILIAIIVFYMFLTGLSSSVLRAGLMLIIYHLSHFARREPDEVTSLFVSVGIIFVVSPFSVGDVGLLLSFMAMFANIIVRKLGMPEKLFDLCTLLSEKGWIKKRLASAIRSLYMSTVTGIAVIVMTLPVMWITFGRVSVLSPLSTAILEIPVSAVLYLAPVIAITYRLPWLCRLFSYPCSFFCRLSVTLVRMLAKTDGAEFILPTENVIGTLGPMIIVICIILAAVSEKHVSKIACASLLLSITMLFSGILIYRNVYEGDEVTYLCMAKNEGFAVTDGVKSLVCDISTGGYNITSACVEEVRTRGASRINVYLLTHLHSRHEKTAAKLFEREYVDEIWLPSPITDSDRDILHRISAIAENNSVKVKIYNRGTEIVFGSVRIDTAVAMIPRSTHPTTALSFESERRGETERVTYVGSSVHEGDAFDHAIDMCRASDTVIFGIHGPVMKSGADYGLFYDTEIVFADSNVAEWFVDSNEVKTWNIYE